MEIRQRLYLNHYHRNKPRFNKIQVARTGIYSLTYSTNMYILSNHIQISPNPPIDPIFTQSRILYTSIHLGHQSVFEPTSAFGLGAKYLHEIFRISCHTRALIGFRSPRSFLEANVTCFHEEFLFCILYTAQRSSFGISRYSQFKYFSTCLCFCLDIIFSSQKLPGRISPPRLSSSLVLAFGNHQFPIALQPPTPNPNQVLSFGAAPFSNSSK